MAKVCSVVIGLCCLFSLIIKNCDTLETQHLNVYIYGVNYHPNNQAIKIDEIHSLSKRQTSTLEKPLTNNTNAVVIPESLNITKQSNQQPNIENGDTAIVNKMSAIHSTKIPTLLGVNGSGQRHDIEPPPSEKNGLTIIGNVTILKTDENGMHSFAGETIDKSNNNGTEYIPAETIGDIDVPDNETKIEAEKHNIMTFKEDYYQYYNSTISIDSDAVKQYWNEIKNLSMNSILLKSHRRAITIQLSFDFPFYGHPVRNITVATGGFLYTGEYVHSWLAATQYIAPLMGNFDTSISNDSFVKLNDNGTVFTVLWENVTLQDKQNVGSFTFSVSLFKTGDIRFVYYGLPILIESISDDKHPVKIGLSDAYIIDKTVFFARRKTIYEYHRVNFESQDIKNDTIINLTAQPTCLEFTDCQKCLEVLSQTFKCSWCPTLNKCSTGTDRKRQDWLQKGCNRTQITDVSQCAPIGTKGNNYGHLQEIEIKEDVLNSDEKWIHHHNGDTMNASPKDNGHAGDGVTHIKTAESLSHDESSGVGLVVGLFVPLLFIFTLILWVFYAYRNPHTKSGQLLIQYRPSQWTWRRGEARYTAATIHM